MKTSRKYDIDFLRVLSAFMVVLLHASAMGNLVPGVKDFTVNVIINSLTRFSVPVFIMISGYFMLGKEEDLSFFVKRAVKLIFIMTGWSAVYLVRYCLSGALIINSFKDAVVYLLTEPMHLWYFYALFALTLLTPAMGIFARNCDKKTYIYTMTLMLVLGSVVTMLVKENSFPTLMKITEKLKIGTVLTFPAYYLFGYFVKRFGQGRKISLFLFLAGLFLTIVGVLILSHQKGVLSENVLSFFSLNVAFAGMGIFAFFEGREIKGKGFIKLVAPLTAGIYGLHMLILPLVYEKMTFLSVSGIKIVCSALVTFILSGAVVFIFKYAEKIVFRFGKQKKM